ncbi:hypothetical protein BU25DRAFT_346006 [Macroventuria anomochaeta]|uniref:Uncharacterized protein n=1 Tax=Macroventuria anomochaeta TaxID=301207 RepID=A0ACB6RVH1_9PLEO|nr:uncharacterized protein BU25DRAFT_346006 [Macroventuria anomochaeta]KAF2625420.1 hypothetical protein BU25DRAFT_346006 [Macroventuria anomochaeta]
MPRGRTCKHATASQAVEAARQLCHQRYLCNHQPQGPPEFIAYEPLLPGDPPCPTPINTGLQISSDIPIPRDKTSGHNPTLLDEHP